MQKRLQTPPDLSHEQRWFMRCDKCRELDISILESLLPFSSVSLGPVGEDDT